VPARTAAIIDPHSLKGSEMIARTLLHAARQAVLSWALGVTLAGMREQAVQVVVDDRLGLPG
jgi:hypothetical protein